MDREVIARRLHEARRDLLASRTQVEGDGLGEPDVSDIAEPRDAGEAASDLVERELDQSMAGMVDAQLAEIDAAQARLSEGTYGRCEVCGEAIGDARLRALPWARRCVTHQQHDEQARTGLEES